MNELIKDMSLDELFNPSEYTEKELLKLVYRELHNLRSEFDDYRKNNTVQKELAETAKRLVSLETQVEINKKLQEQAEKRNTRTIAYITIGLSVLALALKFLIH